MPHVVRVVAAAAAVAALATACAAGSAEPAVPARPSPPLTVFPAVPATPQVAGEQRAEPAKPAARTVPGKGLDVRITAYDRATNLASFFVTKTQSTGGGPQVLDVPGRHRLPLAPAAKLTSAGPGGFPFETCPPEHCTTADELESVVGHYPGGLFARIQIDGSGRITTIAESAP